LISDAGTPLLSDPGHVVVNDVIAAGYPVVPIPGASALLAALAVSGLPPHPFLFYGFLDAKANKRDQQLKQLAMLPYTLVFYESPHRIHKTIDAMAEVFGERPLVIARELTKRYEELIRGTTRSMKDLGPLKGELVLLVGGATQTSDHRDEDLLAEIEELIEAGTSTKDAIRIVASRHDLAKNDVYALYHRTDTKE
jgi:16S rRNA (cytidine1402-2'-O)-methyltransferase